MRRTPWPLGFVLFAFLLTSCAVKQPPVVGRSDRELYASAEQAIQRKEYEAARNDLQQLLKQFPESELQPWARLLLGRAFFLEQQYDEARAEYAKFLDLYPQHEMIDEAHYFTGLSYFYQMEKVDRDQSFTQKALEHFQLILAEMPDSSYVQDVKVKAAICRRRLAEKELYVGTFYLHRGNYAAALARFETVLNHYRGIGLDDRALFYKMVSLLRLEQKGKAQEAFRRLLEEHPGSPLVKEAAKELGISLPVVAFEDGRRAPEPAIVGQERPATFWEKLKEFLADLLGSPGLPGLPVDTGSRQP
ncbi:MAG: outer membrane protein assembly factor BamD [Candidatus Methylomirabilales bacterium]